MDSSRSNKICISIQKMLVYKGLVYCEMRATNDVQCYDSYKDSMKFRAKLS